MITSIYLTAFVLGFFTSFGWWTAGKVQKQIDNAPVIIKVETENKNSD